MAEHERIIHNIALDFKRNSNVQKIYANQNEINIRSVSISFFSDGSEWTAPTGTTVIMSYQKPDGTQGEYDTLPDGLPAYTFNNSRTAVTIKLAPQMFTAAGAVKCKVKIASTNPVQVLSTFRFDMLLDADTISADIPSEHYFSVKSFEEMYTAIDSAEEKAATALSTANAALAATTKDITAEYNAAVATRPTLTPDEFFLEQQDGMYIISTYNGGDCYTARVVTTDQTVNADVVEFDSGDIRFERHYISGRLISTLTENSDDEPASINPAQLMSDMAVSKKGGWRRTDVTLSDSAQSVIIPVGVDVTDVEIQFEVHRSAAGSNYIWVAPVSNTGAVLTYDSQALMRLGPFADQLALGTVRCTIADYFATSFAVWKAADSLESIICNWSQTWGNAQSAALIRQSGKIGLTISDGFTAGTKVTVRYR